MNKQDEPVVMNQVKVEEKQKPLRRSEKTTLALDKLLKQIGIELAKTENCIHKGSCFSSLLIVSLKSLMIGYGIKLISMLVFALRKIITKPKTIKNILTDKNPVKFGLFLGSFTFIFRGIVCSLRRFLSKEKEKYIYLVAGFIGGLISILFLEKDSRQAIGLFLLARAIDISYQTLVKKGYLPEFKYFYVFLYGAMMYITGYCYMNEPGSLSPETGKFYDLFINGNLNDMLMRKIQIQRKNNELALRGIARQNPEDYIPKLARYYAKLRKQ